MTDFYKVVGALRNRIESGRRECQAVGCPTEVNGLKPPFCEKHWRMLPESLRATLTHGSPASRDEKLERAMDIIAMIEDRGRG